MEKEIWKSVKGYEGFYEVSNFGRVQSLDRIVIDKNGCKLNFKGKIRKTSLNMSGYPILNLNKQGVKKTRTVHQLVAESFLNHKPCGYKFVVDHINGVTTDNNLSNLQIVTSRENSSTCYRVSNGSHSSTLVGSFWNKNGQFWESAVVFNGKSYHLGSFKCESEAHNTYKRAVKDIKKGIFNHDDYRTPTSSNLKGIYWDGKVWVAQINVNGYRLRISTHKDELEASNAYQQAKKELALYGLVCVKRKLVRLFPFKYHFNNL